jgi:hypothetical protein
MKQGYDTCSQESPYPRFTVLKRNTARQWLLYLGYFLSCGVLYILGTWMQSIQCWPFDAAPEGDFLLIEDSEQFFEIVALTSLTVQESSLSFSKPPSPKTIQVPFT